MLGLFIIYFGLAVWSCFPSEAQKEEYLARRRARESKWAALEAEHEEAKRQGLIEGLPANSPETPGLQSGMNPMTPRTFAFNKLGGTKNKSREKPARTPTVEVSHADDIEQAQPMHTNYNPQMTGANAVSGIGEARGSGGDLPLRNHFSTPRPTSPTYALRSPGLPTSPLNMGFGGNGKSPEVQQGENVAGPSSPPQQTSPMFFPPPPKKEIKQKGKK